MILAYMTETIATGSCNPLYLSVYVEQHQMSRDEHKSLLLRYRNQSAKMRVFNIFYLNVF